MLGAIIGDIAGSRFEFSNLRSKNFELFTDECFVTDDSIISLAVAKAIMESYKIFKVENCVNDFDIGYFKSLSEMTVKYMQEIGQKYPNCGYGGMFAIWVFSKNPQPYNSFGNGAAMRISPAGFAARSEMEAINLSDAITRVTHNHEEGIKGAQAIAVAIYIARQGFSKAEIRRKITDYYPLDFTIDEIRPSYKFNETCQETVPQAINCFLESESFEDAIRTAISLGGDSDTIAAITGAIAEAFYGIPDFIRKKALTYLDQRLRAIYDDWEDFILTCVKIPPTVFTIAEFVLHSEESSNIDIRVCAEISDGCLKISGHDIGKTANEIFGESEYEYYYDFDRKNTIRLLRLINLSSKDINELFLKNFGGNDGCRTLRELCDKNNISYKFYSC